MKKFSYIQPKSHLVWIYFHFMRSKIQCLFITHWCLLNYLIVCEQFREYIGLAYPEIFPLSALIACNAMNWPGGTAIYFSHKFHHWLMLYTFGQYIVNVQWSITGDRFLTIFKFGIRWQRTNNEFLPTWFSPVVHRRGKWLHINGKKTNYIKSTFISFPNVCLYGCYTKCQFCQI